MADFVLVFIAVPTAAAVYLITNVGSIIEGKGTRFTGGLLDVALMSGSIAAANVAMNLSEKTLVETLKIEDAGRPMTSTRIALMSAATSATYVAAKSLVGSPTSLTTNLIVGAASGALLPAAGF